jgi:UDP-N-acetylmuramate: L-alanyl-gamma-D-glutamyl-meso-diaminopimelate ligase
MSYWADHAGTQSHSDYFNNFVIMRIHFIAIGGSAMHNLAIALHRKGYEITGSDDEIFEPSRTRLLNHGILPSKEGWYPEKITADLDAVVLGMHARNDNPELLRAKELGIRIFSYPEYLYEQSKAKKRVVVGGSHGKTTITAMILHVLQRRGMEADYMVGAQLEGFDVMVKISETAPLMVLEGDEYLTSPIDRRPKFHLYKPDIALVSGIAWDHINVFPTFEEYVEQFRIFTDLISQEGVLIYCDEDEEVRRLGEAARNDLKKVPYGIPMHRITEGKTIVPFEGREYQLKIFGDHNLLNMNGARLVCQELGIPGKEFYEAIVSFGGASKRLQKIGENHSTTVFKDFAHAPSKLKASTRALKKQFPDRALVACIELHTFSSLNKDFLPFYKGSLDDADHPIVYFSPHALALKKLPPIHAADVRNAFGNKSLNVFTNPEELEQALLKINWKEKNLLMMSSGSFDGLNLDDLADRILK